MTIPFKKISHEEALLLLKSLPLEMEMRIVVERNGKLPAYQKLLKSPDCFYIKATQDFRPPESTLRKVTIKPKIGKNKDSIKSSISSKNSCCDTTSSSDETSNSQEIVFDNPGNKQFDNMNVTNKFVSNKYASNKFASNMTETTTISSNVS